MHFLDFLSESPKLFIFQKESNKTNFGGVLFLIYIIIMLLISSTYIANYLLNDKYTYEALTFYNHTEDIKEIENMNNDIELNPFLNLSLYFYTPEDKFTVFDQINQKFIEKSSLDIYGFPIYYIKKQISDINFIIYYKCEDKNCNSLDDFLETYGYSSFTGVYINYTRYEINHFDEIPVSKKDHYPETFNDSEINEGKRLEIWNFEWEIIKYKDQRSLFDSLTKNRKEYIFGHIKNKTPQINYKGDNYVEHINNQDYYFPLFQIQFTNNHNEYLLYKRKKVEFLDVLANIGALFSTIKFVFSFVFNFYSKNFDNYKIVGKILSHQNELREGKELKTEFNKSINKDEEKNLMNNINKLEPLIFDNTNENNKNEKGKIIKKNDDDNDNDEEDSPIVLNKLHFYDFFFNNIYSKCCKVIKNQEILNITNSIIYKYLSIDSLLYNQIKLENLFDDYTWNNPSLNSINKNLIIKKLKISSC